ncbi:hypothetical protein BC830DRAFT_1062175, partial [Chytriomyces sp. MP71]
QYAPITQRNLPHGKSFLWCTCGLSKTQPWCDQSHRGTQFKPLHWKVSGTRKDGGAQTLYSICACKYTSDPPFCDATHTSLPLKYLKQIKECTAAEGHTAVEKICELCGFVPGVLDDSEGDEEPTDTQ